MLKLTKFIIVISIIFGFIFSISRKININLMEFDNISQSLRYNTLSRELPNIIKAEYSNIEGVNIEYAGNLFQYLQPIKDNRKISNEVNLIITGSYTLNGSDLKIFYELIDMENWTVLSSAHMDLFIEDLDLLKFSFLNRIHEILNPYVPITAAPLTDLDDSDLNN